MILAVVTQAGYSTDTTLDLRIIAAQNGTICRQPCPILHRRVARGAGGGRPPPPKKKKKKTQAKKKKRNREKEERKRT